MSIGPSVFCLRPSEAVHQGLATMKLEIRFLDGETVVWDMQVGEGEMVLSAFEDYLNDRGPKGCACRRAVEPSAGPSKVTLAFPAVASMSEWSECRAARLAAGSVEWRRLGREKPSRIRTTGHE